MTPSRISAAATLLFLPLALGCQHAAAPAEPTQAPAAGAPAEPTATPASSTTEAQPAVAPSGEPASSATTPIAEAPMAQPAASAAPPAASASPPAGTSPASKPGKPAPAPEAHAAAGGYSGPDGCETTAFRFGALASACRSGGRLAAKGVMKGVVQKAKAAGEDLKCTSCHEDMKSFHLKANAVSDLKKWL